MACNSTKKKGCTMRTNENPKPHCAHTCAQGPSLLTTLSARLGSTTLARGMLTGSLLGCTVLSGMLMGRLVMVSPWLP